MNPLERVAGWAEGFSEMTLRRARKKLGIQPTKEGYQGPWVWGLSSKMVKNAKDGQAKKVSIFGKVDHLCGPQEGAEGVPEASAEVLTEEEI
jgi:hypothetical protein